MPLALIETGHCNVDLKPSPIEPSWIIEGNPEARSYVLSTSACGTAKTMVWSCTEGKFNWYYDLDETIVIIEGSILLESEGIPPTRFGVGDVIVFRRGARAKWHVEGYVKKVAFLRLNNPLPLGFAVRAVNKLRFLIARYAPMIATACVIVAEQDRTSTVGPSRRLAQRADMSGLRRKAESPAEGQTDAIAPQHGPI